MSHLDRKRMRELTMGCWWSSTAFPKAYPDWHGISSELFGLADDELTIRHNEARHDEALRLARLAADHANS